MALGESLLPSCSHTLHCKIMMHWTRLKSPGHSKVSFLFASISALIIGIEFTFVLNFQGWECHRDETIIGYLRLNGSFLNVLLFAFQELVLCIQKCKQGAKKIRKKSKVGDWRHRKTTQDKLRGVSDRAKSTCIKVDLKIDHASIPNCQKGCQEDLLSENVRAAFEVRVKWWSLSGHRLWMNASLVCWLWTSAHLRLDRGWQAKVPVVLNGTLS